MLYDYLKENYREDEPIIFNDVVYLNYSRPVLNQMFRALCNEGKLVKYDTGIYFIPGKSRLKSNTGLNADIAAYYKYIHRNGKTFGYYSGNSFANKIGISTQVPYKVEITSNHMAAQVRELEIGKRTFIVRHPVVPVTNENAPVLSMLDLLKNLEIYMDDSYRDAAVRFEEYIRKYHITKESVDQYIRFFPSKIFRNYYETGLDHVLA